MACVVRVSTRFPYQVESGSMEAVDESSKGAAGAEAVNEGAAGTAMTDSQSGVQPTQDNDL